MSKHCNRSCIFNVFNSVAISAFKGKQCLLSQSAKSLRFLTNKWNFPECNLVYPQLTQVHSLTWFLFWPLQSTVKFTVLNVHTNYFKQYSELLICSLSLDYILLPYFRSANFSCKGSNSKCFRFCRPYKLYHNHSPLLLWCEINHKWMSFLGLH